MTAINYLNDKFVPTPLPEICAFRTSLLTLYEKAALNRLAVVCAPAGYGKTVSTLLWLKTSGRKSVWFGLDKYDNAPFVFYKMLCAGIMSAQPDNAKMETILNSPDFFSSPVEYTINLLLEFRQDERTYALVFDDFHTITNKKIIKSLPYILKRLPHSFHILILSRNKLPVEMNEFAQSRSCVEITAGDLAFSAQEIQSYFFDLGQPVSAEQAQTLYEKTGGWAIAINVLSKNNAFESHQGGENILEQYITNNIWGKWDLALREFMIRTCLADEMDAELCRALTGQSNTDEILEKLLVQNLFAVKTSTHTYRYHHLFSDFLKSKLKERNDINISGLLLEIAGLYYIRGEYFRALDYYVRAKNHEGIMKCIPRLNSLYLDFDVGEWVNYFSNFVYDRLSEEFIQQNIFLVMEYAWLNHLNGNAAVMLHYIDIMNDYLADEQNKEELLERNIIGYACIIKFTDFRETVYEYSKKFSAWTNSLPEMNFDLIRMSTPTVTQNFPFLHRSVFDCLSMIPDMDKQLLEISHAFGMFFVNEVDIFCNCVRAGLYYELNLLDKAYEAILLTKNIINRETRFEIQFCVFMMLSQIQYAQGKTNAAMQTQEYFAKRVVIEHAQYLNPNFIAVNTKYKLWDGDRKSAKAWFDQFFVTDDEQFYFYKLYQYFTSARSYIVLSKFEDARDFIEKIKKLSSDYNRPLDIAEAGVLLSVVECATGLTDKAVESLKKVLLLTQQYRVVRIIADEGASVLPILKKIAAKIGGADAPEQIDSHYLNQVIFCAHEVSKQHAGITASLNEKAVKLSKQQMNILTMLGQGYKRAEIASLTGLSINTVKAHIKLIYSKFDVNTAADAVLEAKRRGMIES